MPRKLALAAFTVVALAAVALLARDDARAAGATVDVGDFYFCNSSFQAGVCDTNINVGDAVTWQWVSSEPHTVTECNDTFAMCPHSGGGFDSGTLTSGMFVQPFNTAGVFEYQCNIHGSLMRGRITVTAQATATPTPTVTAAPGAASPTPTSLPSAQPGSVPGAGGLDSGGMSESWQLALMAVGGVLLAGSALAIVRAARTS